MRHKVMHLASTAQGGMRRHLMDLVKGLNKDEFHPVIAAANCNSWLGNLREGGLEVFPLELNRWSKPFLTLAGLWDLTCLLMDQKIKILHVHSLRAALLGRIAAPLAGIPIVVYTVHNYPNLWPGLAFGVERQLHPLTDRIITVSEALRQELLNQGIPEKQVVTIYNGVDLKTVAPRRWDKDPNIYRIGMVGRLVGLKGVEVFLRAGQYVSRNHPRAKFFVIGDGPLKGDLEGLAQTLNIEEKVVFTGYQENLNYWWSKLDILVCCSLQEGLGLSILEAMARGIPVVATRVGGISEILEEGGGLLVAPGSSEELGAAILKLLEDPEKARGMGHIGQQVVQRKFSLDKMITATENLYRQLLQGTGDYHAG